MEFSSVANLLQPLLEASQTYGDALVPLGQKILSLSLIMTLASGIYTWWAGDIQNAFAKMLRGALLFAIPMVMLSGSHWVQYTGTLANFFQQEITAPLIAKSGGNASGGGTELVKTMVAKIGNSIWQDKPETLKKQSTWEMTKEFLSNPANTVGDALFGALTDLFLRVLLTLVGMILIMAMLFALYAPLLMLQFGIILGPILICWLPYRPLSDLARQWLKFMITSGMSLVVGVLLVLVSAHTIDIFISSISLVGGDPDLPWYMEIIAKVGAFISAASVMLFVALMMFRADSIASALVGGATEGSGVGAVIMRSVEKVGNSGGAPKPDVPKPVPK